jgi:hypothetical protein
MRARISRGRLGVVAHPRGTHHLTASLELGPAIKVGLVEAGGIDSKSGLRRADAHHHAARPEHRRTHLHDLPTTRSEPPPTSIASSAGNMASSPASTDRTVCDNRRCRATNHCWALTIPLLKTSAPRRSTVLRHALESSPGGEAPLSIWECPPTHRAAGIDCSCTGTPPGINHPQRTAS